MSTTTVGARTVHVVADGVRTPVAISRLAAVAEQVLKAEKVTRCDVSVTLVSARIMAGLNKKHLQHSGPTDVITFALEPAHDGALAADIYVCPEVARTQALEHGAGVREELLRLVVHGLLHACGHDHPIDDARTTSAMWQRQERLLKRFQSRPVV